MYFISFCVILLIVSSSYGFVTNEIHHDKLEGCSCDDIICPKDVTTECVAGIVTDICDCCPNGVCGQREGQRCYDSQSSIDEDRKYGICGAEMLCSLKEHYTSNMAESICVCKDERTVCGSNNKTYDTPCQLKEDVAQDPTIHIQYWGPCKTVPSIVTSPQDGAVTVKRDVFLDCEIHGNPVPLVHWEFVSDAGLLKLLPGDDSNIVVQTRGGPENLMITSYLQIFQMRETDVGTYMCIAQNEHGKAQASARITMK